MFEAGCEERPWRIYIQDMIDFGEKVLAYTEGLAGKRSSPMDSYMTQHSIIWGVIQEAVPDLLPALRKLLESESGAGK